MAKPKPVNLDNQIRHEYQRGHLYKPETICKKFTTGSPEYTDRLLEEKIALVEKHTDPDNPLLDVCCATGEHLFVTAHLAKKAIGIDFSIPFISRANQSLAKEGKENVQFCVANAKSLPLSDDSVGTAYSFSALYAIPQVEEVISEIHRVLMKGGRCILDMGNRNSINKFCLRYYTDYPPTYPISVQEMQNTLNRFAFKTLEHKSFQILPLWAGQPKWLWPVLHPAWKSIMAKRIGNRMLDEWISSAPGVKSFAFRHIFVCEKT